MMPFDYPTLPEFQNMFQMHRRPALIPLYNAKDGSSESAKRLAGRSSSNVEEALGHNESAVHCDQKMALSE